MKEQKTEKKVFDHAETMAVRRSKVDGRGGAISGGGVR